MHAKVTVNTIIQSVVITSSFLIASLCGLSTDQVMNYKGDVN